MKTSLHYLSEEISYQFQCALFRMSAPGETRKKILINGTPKTGTTWMVRLFESIPGYHWRHEFGHQISSDLLLLDQLQAGDILHAHYNASPELEQGLLANQVQVVILLRDPRDQVISNLFHLRRDTTNAWHTTFLELTDEQAILALIEGLPGGDGKPPLRSVTEAFDISLSWKRCQVLSTEHRFAKSGAERAVSSHAMVNIAFVRYEDLICDTQATFQHVLEHVGIQVSPRAKPLIHAISQRNRFERMSVGRRFWKAARQAGQQDPNSHFRKGIIGDWRNYFSPQHIERFKAVAGDLLIQLNYETDLAW